MKIVVCVSDEVLNSQHYKHSQSTEASDQYANELILYLNELLNEDCLFITSCQSLSLHITHRLIFVFSQLFWLVLYYLMVYYGVDYDYGCIDIFKHFDYSSFFYIN